MKMLKRIPNSLVALIAFSGLLFIVLGCSGATQAGWSGPLLSDETLYVGGQQGDLLALNLKDGNQKWARKLVGPAKGGFGCLGPAQRSSAVYGTATVSEKTVYAASYNGKIYAFDADDGTQKWVYPEKGTLPAIVGGGAVSNGIVAFGDSDGKIYGLDSATGTQKWAAAAQGKVWATPVADKGVLYTPSLDGRVYAIRTSDGAIQWNTERVGGMVSSPALTQDTIIVGSLDNHLYAFERANGNKKWQFLGGNFFWASPVLSGSLVVAANTEGKVYGLDARDGRLVWEWASPEKSSISSTPVVLNGSVAVATLSGKINLINTSNGLPARDPISTGATGSTSIKGPLAARGNVVYARLESGKTAFAVGYDVTNGAQVMSKEIIATAAPAETAPESSSPFNLQTILLTGMAMVIVFLLFGRRAARR
ncbi:MAG: PQQ-like beta-propeller repeat protein [Chloroflexi bacterium]|nr:PQQ-like beta-propeller repeat protein [Chloroflexota bacterium]